MARIARLPLLLAALVLVTAVAATPASAAKRRVPFGFFGTTLATQFANPSVLPDATLDQQVALMAANGVESLRVVLDWRNLEPSRGSYDWTEMDRLVAITARHGVKFLPNVSATPRWIAERPRRSNQYWRPGNRAEYWRAPPRSPAPYAELHRRLVLRYGPRGTFWTQNPDPALRQNPVPVRDWQIWNEPTARWFWDRRRYARSYTRLLRASYRAIHRADRGARVVVGGLVAGAADYPPWDAMRDLYRAGGKRWFDVVAVHPFTNTTSARVTVRRTVEVVRRVRAHMRRNGDRRTPVILTEMTWPAALGKVPRDALVRLSTTTEGQVARLKEAYRQFARARRRLNVTEVYWFTWSSQYDATGGHPSAVQFRFTGLTRYRGAVFTPMPLLGVFANTAAKYQGCRKTTNARICR